MRKYLYLFFAFFITVFYTIPAIATGTLHSGTGIIPPYVEDFESDDIIDMLTIIDANNDGRTWKIVEKDGNRSARIDCNIKKSMDDWLIMPCIKLETGKNYRISFRTTTYNSPYFPERLEVCIGNEATIEAMQNGVQLITPTELKNLDGYILGGTFVPETDGIYYIGLHGMSDADMFFIIIDDFTVEEGVFDAGPAIPSKVGNIDVEEVEEGRVRISWTPPTVDINGRPIDSQLRYKIIDANYRTVVEDLDATEYIYNAVKAGEQDIVYYYVGAANEMGYGEFKTSDLIIVGTPYAYPYTESFNNGSVKTLFGTTRPEDSYAEWEVYTEETAGITDADGTNGFIGMYGYKTGDCSSLYTGKISLSGAERPILSFYYNALTADNQNTMEVAVREVLSAEHRVQKQEWEVLKDFIMDGAAENYEWIKMTLPLEAYKGKTIQLKWTPTSVNYEFGLIDGICVDEAIVHDLEACSIIAPTEVSPNKEFAINVIVANNGLESAGDYTVALYRDGKKVQEMANETIACGARANITFNEVLNVTSSDVTYHAIVNYTADSNTGNNTTESLKVRVKVPAFPIVTDLTVSQDDSGLRFAWNAPDLNNLPLASVTEDFENAEPYAQTLDGWTFVDGDDANIGGIQGVTLPFQKASWFIMDSSDSSFGKTFASHSATKHLSTMFNLQGEQNDDWLISPLLYGEEQTISFWAKSYISDYGLETMEFLYSTIDNDPASFVPLNSTEVPSEWTEFSFDIPSGTKYFAIRYTSKDVYMLFVDDVTYIPYGAEPQSYSILGYNIYRDGVKINDKLIADQTYIDALATEGLHTYVVTVVYEQGESAPSNNVSIHNIAGIESVRKDDITVASAKSAIIVSGAMGKTIKIYTIDGQSILRINALPCTTIDVNPGLYIVEVSGKKVKVVVK